MVPATGAYETARLVTVCSNTRKTCTGTVNVQYTPMCTGEQGHREGGRGYNDPGARGGVEDTRLEAKAKDTKKIRGQGQGQPFRGQTLSRPRTGMLEAKAKDQGHSRKCSRKKKVFKKVFQAISNLKAEPEFLIGEA